MDGMWVTWTPKMCLVMKKHTEVVNGSSHERSMSIKSQNQAVTSGIFQNPFWVCKTAKMSKNGKNGGDTDPKNVSHNEKIC